MMLLVVYIAARATGGAGEMPAEQVIAVGFVGDGTARAGGPNVCGAAEWRAAESLRVTREDGF